MGDYCCGCGNDVTEKRNKRRLLSSAKSQHVLSVWNGFLDKFSVSLGELSPGYLCRSCFSTYERYINLQRSIEENLENALEAVEKSTPKKSSWDLVMTVHQSEAVFHSQVLAQALGYASITIVVA